MRAFVAISLPDTILSELGRRQAAFRAAQLAAGDGDAGVRWVRTDAIHLTLKFLGEITPVKANQVAAAFDSLTAFRPFQAEVRGFGFFPDARRPRVFWAGVAAGPELAELARSIEAATESIGFPAEDRRFSPHLTLARFTEARPQSALQALANESGAASLGRFDVSDFCLFESKLRAGAPAEYRRVACWPRPL